VKAISSACKYMIYLITGILNLSLISLHGVQFSDFYRFTYLAKLADCEVLIASVTSRCAIRNQFRKLDESQEYQ